MRIFLTISYSHPYQSFPYIIFWIQKRDYIFNMPALYQRFYKTKGLNSNSCIFLTNLSSDHMSGFFGYLSSLPMKQLNFQTKLYGPSLNLKELLYRRRLSLGLHSLKYSSFSFDPKVGLPEKRVLLGVKNKDQLLNLIGKYMKREIVSNLEQFSLKKEDLNDASVYINKNNNFKDDIVEIIPIYTTDEESKRSILSYILKIASDNKNEKIRIKKRHMKQFDLDYTDVKNIVLKKEIIKNGQKLTLEQLLPSLERNLNVMACLFLIIDCPNLSIMQQITRNPIFFEDKKTPVKGIIHLAPLSIVEKTEYMDFIKKFDRNSVHIFCCPEINKVNFHKNFTELKKKYKFVNLVLRFQIYFPEHFPLMKFSQNFPEIESRMLKLKNNVPNSLLPTDHNFFEFFSDQNLEKVFTAPFNSNKTYSFKEPLEFMSFYQLYQKEKQKYDKTPRVFDPEIVFLGTNSAQPSLYRNVSSIYLNIKNFGIVMDCGEGTYFQFLFHFGPENIEKVLLNIKVIYITHFHLDHTMGITEILKERMKVLKKNGLDLLENRIFLVIPENLLPSLEDIRNLAEDLDGFQYIFTSQLRNIWKGAEIHTEYEENKMDLVGHSDIMNNTKTNLNTYNSDRLVHNQNANQIVDELNKVDLDLNSEEIEVEKFYSDQDLAGSISTHSKECDINLTFFIKAIELAGLKSIRTINTLHCQNSHAIIIEHKNGVKIVYSGDTMYSDSLIKEGKNATILIHEATFLERRVGSHSTIFEAIITGMKMNAWRTILTHFSKGVYNLNMKETLKGEKKEIRDYGEQRVILALDHLKGKISEFEYLPAINNCINMLHPINDFSSVK